MTNQKAFNGKYLIESTKVSNIYLSSGTNEFWSGNKRKVNTGLNNTNSTWVLLYTGLDALDDASKLYTIQNSQNEYLSYDQSNDYVFTSPINDKSLLLEDFSKLWRLTTSQDTNTVIIKNAQNNRLLYLNDDNQSIDLNSYSSSDSNRFIWRLLIN